MQVPTQNGQKQYNCFFSCNPVFMRVIFIKTIISRENKDATFQDIFVRDCSIGQNAEFSFHEK